MTTHSEKRVMPYSAQQMYDLIADIEKYGDFLPWCAAVRKRSSVQDGPVEIVDADMIVSFKVFREKFGCRVKLNPSEGTIDVSYLDGPFRYLENNWRFTPQSQNTCEVDFYVDFEFKSRTLQALIGVVFHEAMRQVVGAFERRAVALYGQSPPEISLTS